MPLAADEIGKSNINQGGTIEERWIVQSQVGEYFGLCEVDLVEIWDDLPPGRPVLVTRYNGMNGKQGTEVKFIKRALKKPEKVALQEYISLFNLIQSKEDDMSLSKDLVAIAAEKGPEALETALQERVKVMIRRAAKYAEENNNFLAMPVIDEVQAKYGTPVSAGKALDNKEAKELKLAKDTKVSTKVWDAIMGKASKVGMILTNKDGKATLRIKNADYEAFVKAAKAVPGITVA